MRLGSLLGWFVLAIACSREPAQPLVRSADAANSATPGSASPSGGAPSAPRPSAEAVEPPPGAASATAPPNSKPTEMVAWTDAAAVDALALDCNFKPAQAADQPEPSPLSCSSGLYEQSCIYDPCYATDQSQCKPRCEKSCDACSDQCSAGCGRCKARCTDDACRRECAATCANCKQGCLGTKDRCATGTCGAQYKACTELLTKRWNSSGCAKTCKAYQECTGKCQEGPACQSSSDLKACDACSERCAAQVRRGCPQEFVDLCLFNGAPP